MVLVSILGDFHSSILPIFYEFKEKITKHILIHDDSEHDIKQLAKILKGQEFFLTNYETQNGRNLEFEILPIKVKEDSFESIQQCYKEIIKHSHSSIKDFFNTGKGIELQNFDSMIAEEVINEFTNQDIPILCIHDSFVISSEYVKKLEIVMKEKFDLVCEKLELKSKGTKLKSDGLLEGIFESWLNKQEYKDTFIDNMIKSASNP